VKVVGYARVSTREQSDEGRSLITQRAAIRAHCEQRGWQLVDVIEDDGYTGTSDDRPGLQRALTMLKRKQARAIVVARMDRLARSTQDLCRFITKARRQKWSMVALDMHLDTTTANGRLVIRILASVAEWESEMISERVKDGMAEARSAREAEGAPIGWGFQRSTPDDVVRRIVRARNRGESFNAIAARLDANHTPTPGGGYRWYPSTVRRIYNAETATKASAA
jgi:DNA invertase Pin-like site-specific DNA recombinase